MTKASPRSIGDAAEEAAVVALRRARYRILLRNVTTPAGEIDVVALRSGVVTFVEVRSRKASAGRGTAYEALTPRKMARVARASEHLLAARGLSGSRRAFLGVAVDLDPQGAPAHVSFHPVEEIR